MHHALAPPMRIKSIQRRPATDFPRVALSVFDFFKLNPMTPISQLTGPFEGGFLRTNIFFKTLYHLAIGCGKVTTLLLYGGPKEHFVADTIELVEEEVVRPVFVRVELDAWACEVLEALASELSQSEAAREFGVNVTLEVAARVAMMRGLKAIKQGRRTQTSPVEQAPVNETEKPATPPVEIAKHNPDGTIVPPAGWNKWSQTEAITPETAKIHEYYTTNGWARYAGVSGNEAMVFYWCEHVDYQKLDPYPHNDKKGKKILIQETPWGPGHLIPFGWNEV